MFLGSFGLHSLELGVRPRVTFRLDLVGGRRSTTQVGVGVLGVGVLLVGGVGEPWPLLLLVEMHHPRPPFLPGALVPQGSIHGTRRHPVHRSQVWPLTQFYSVDCSQSRIGV